jgi:hypothetical protein
MAYRESRAKWRKLWRKEPELRRAVLSHHARALIALLLRYADDAGCLGPVSRGKQPASTLAQMLAIQPGNRKAFYREIQELLDHGDDGEPLALVIADGHYHLTRFKDCQAVRSKGDHRAVAGQSSDGHRSVTGLSSGSHRAVTGQSLATNAAESFNTETDLATEDRSKKIEVRSKKIEDRSYDLDVDQQEDPEPPSTADAPTPSNVVANLDAGLWLRGEWERRQALRSTPAKWKAGYQPHIESVVRKASEATGDTFAVLNAALDAFFADPDQQEFGCIPKGLDWKWDQFAGPYLEQIKAVDRERKIAKLDRKYKDDLERESQKQLAKVLAKRQAGNSAAPAVVPGNNLGINPEEWS